MIYTRSNGYGTIDTGSAPYQLGARLYDAQCLYADADRGDQIDPDRVKDLAKAYCELVYLFGELRGDYDVMRRCARGEAEYRDQ